VKVEGCVMRITFYFTILKASDPVVSLKPLQRGSCSCFSVFYVVRASGRLFAVRSKYVEPLPVSLPVNLPLCDAVVVCLFAMFFSFSFFLSGDFRFELFFAFRFGIETVVVEVLVLVVCFISI